MLRVLLTEDNDFPPGGPVLGGGIESATTALQAVFGTQAGEWKYDKTFGMLWRKPVLVKYFDPGTTSALTAAKANTVTDINPVTPGQVLIDRAATPEFAKARQVLITIEDVSLANSSSTASFDLVLSTEL